MGHSRCALDYEAEISLRSSCPAQFIKKEEVEVVGRGQIGRWGCRVGGRGISLRETELQL